MCCALAAASAGNHSIGLHRRKSTPEINDVFHDAQVSSEPPLNITPFE
jgi:hypothetical protein